jgi:hypothetical protein
VARVITNSLRRSSELIDNAKWLHALLADGIYAFARWSRINTEFA